MKYLAIMVFANIAFGAGGEGANESNTIRLYQVGTKGHYCVSLSKSTAGCISGVDEDGEPINVLDVAIEKNKGARFVTFENLSDAPHDMKFTGANAEDIPAQEPGGEVAQKAIKIEDLSTQKMNCSFHGDMLGVGYRVPSMISESIDNEPGHRERGEGGTDTVGSKVDPGPAKAITSTGLADVGKEIMKKGRPGEVEKLVGARPELIKDLQESRPLLAREIISKNPALGSAPKAVAAVPKPQGEGDFFRKQAGQQIAGGGPNVFGKPVARGAVGAGGGGVGLTEGSNIQGFDSGRGLASLDDDDWDLEEDGHGEMRTHGSDKKENRAVRTASLDSIPEGMKMKVVRRGGWASQTSGSSFKWIVLGLIAAGFGGYRFFIAGKRKKKGERA
jgi:hypothetical protein